jgi:hypothetical protein
MINMILLIFAEKPSFRGKFGVNNQGNQSYQYLEMNISGQTWLNTPKILPLQSFYKEHYGKS